MIFYRQLPQALLLNVSLPFVHNAPNNTLSTVLRGSRFAQSISHLKQTQAP